MRRHPRRAPGGDARSPSAPPRSAPLPPESPASASPPPSPSRSARLTLLSAWAAVLALVLAFVFIAVTALTLGLWFAHRNSDTTPVTDIGFLALGALVVVGIAMQVRRPERRLAGLRQSTAALLALAAAGLLGRRIEPFTGGLLFLALASPLIFLHPDRGRFLRVGHGASRRLAALALVAAVPAAAYAAAMLASARQAGPSCFLGRCAAGDRFAELAALAIATVLIAALATFADNRVHAWSAATAAAALGTVSIALPAVPGSLGTAGGVLALAWGVLYLAAATASRRASA